MNQAQINKQRHLEALKVVEDFVKAGGKITKAPDNYKGIERKAPKPKRMVIPNQKRV